MSFLPLCAAIITYFFRDISHDESLDVQSRQELRYEELQLLGRQTCTHSQGWELVSERGVGETSEGVGSEEWGSEGGSYH